MPIRINDKLTGTVTTTSPGSDNELVRYDTASGASVQGSNVVVTDTGDFELASPDSVSLFADANTTSLTVGSSSIVVTIDGSTVNVGTAGNSVNILGTTTVITDSSAVGSTTTINGETINIGESGTTINMIGDVNSQQVTNLVVSDKLITLNDGGAVSSGNGVGFEVEENGSATGYVKTKSDRNGFDIKAPNQTGVATVEIDSDNFTVDKTIVKGPTTGTDNKLIKSDGTNGRIIQESGITIDDSNNMSGVGTIGSGTITSSGDVDAVNVSVSGKVETAETANRALTTDVNGDITASAVTSTELGYVSGVTSSIQTQLDDKSTASKTETLTNKTIDADLNTISNLAHGAEVDNPTSGVHGVTGNVVGTTDIQSLTNKAIDGDLNTISNLAHGAEVDNPTSGVHGVTGNVVGTTDTQALTNKTIDGDLNTISNLAHGAEVDNPTSGVHGVTGNVVGTSDTQDLSNKTLTSPTVNGGITDFGTASANDKLVLPSDTKANLDLLTRDEGAIYYATDEDRIYADDGTNLILPEASATFTVVAKSSSATLSTSGEDIITVDSTSADVTLTLPAVSGNSGLRYTIIKEVTANTVIIDGNSTETINGETTFELESQYDSVQIACDGTEWWIESDNTVVAARYSVASGQTLTNNAVESLIYDTKEFDTHNAYSTSTGDYTVPVSGFYRVNINCILDNAATWNAGDELALRIRVNSIDLGGEANHQLSATDFFTINADATLELEKGDVVDFTIKQASGVDVDVQVDHEFNYLEIIRIK